MSARWDRPPSDPIGDIRRGFEMDKMRARDNEVTDAFFRTRFAALVALAREREDAGAAKAAIAATPDEAKRGNVWLADEHGLLCGDAGPIVIPRAIAIGLGAAFEKAPAPLPGEAAVVTTGVKLPKGDA